MTVGRIFVCQPGGRGTDPISAQQFWTGCCKDRQLKLIQSAGRGNKTDSFLTESFNSHLAEAMNVYERLANEPPEDQLTHFAMLHTDVVPMTGWLETLLEDLEAHGATVVSAVIPMKQETGRTSTAIDNADDEWEPRIITMREVFNLPEVFGSEQLGGPILVNTGCFIWDWTKPQDFTPFTMHDRIARGPDGRWRAQLFGEDWNFSRHIRRQGGKIMATRRVQLYHAELRYTNTEPWGTMDFDREHATGPLAGIAA